MDVPGVYGVQVGGKSHPNVSHQQVKNCNPRRRSENDLRSGNRLSLGTLEGLVCNGLVRSERCGVMSLRSLSALDPLVMAGKVTRISLESRIHPDERQPLESMWIYPMETQLKRPKRRQGRLFKVESRKSEVKK
jgi:hypothetical protein